MPIRTRPGQPAPIQPAPPLPPLPAKPVVPIQPVAPVPVQPLPPIVQPVRPQPVQPFPVKGPYTPPGGIPIGRPVPQPLLPGQPAPPSKFPQPILQPRPVDPWFGRPVAPYDPKIGTDPYFDKPWLRPITQGPGTLPPGFGQPGYNPQPPKYWNPNLEGALGKILPTQPNGQPYATQDEYNAYQGTFNQALRDAGYAEVDSSGPAGQARWAAREQWIADYQAKQPRPVTAPVRPYPMPRPELPGDRKPQPVRPSPVKKPAPGGKPVPEKPIKKPAPGDKKPIRPIKPPTKPGKKPERPKRKNPKLGKKLEKDYVLR